MEAVELAGEDTEFADVGQGRGGVGKTAFEYQLENGLALFVLEVSVETVLVGFVRYEGP